MPIPTKPPPPPRPSLPGNRPRTAAALLALATGAALLELLAGLSLGGFLLTGRAEAFTFLLFRPWVVVVLALVAMRHRWRWRAGVYAAFLSVAGLSESFAMLRLGNPEPWAEMLRGWVAGAAVALIVDVALALARRRGRRWAAAAAAVLACLLAVPAVRDGYRAAVAEPLPAAPASPKPEVLLMSALPLVWGEGGAFDPASRPAAIYTALGREFTLHPIDALDEESLGAARLLLLIQPRWLAPGELVALDAWIRRGGRAVILTDPRLDWHSDLPLGDIRRPPPTGLLGPLLDHWGLPMTPGREGRQVELVGGKRRLIMDHPGRLTPGTAACRAGPDFLADCRLGAGRAIVLADADLVRDELWVGPGPDGGSREHRRSDNPLVVADLLDRLAGVDRPRALGEARWHADDAAAAAVLRETILLLAGLGLLGVAARHLLRRRGAR